MTEPTTMTHALTITERVNRVALRQSLRRSLRDNKVKVPFLGSRLEIALFAVAAIALLATPLIRASVKVKEDFVEIATRLRTPSHVDETILTGAVPPRPAAATAPRPATLPGMDEEGPPRLRGSL